MNEKKYLMDVKVYYKGSLSKENEIGHLTLELLIDKKAYEDSCSNVLVETSNCCEVEGQRDHVPVNITKLHCLVSQIVKVENIENGYDASFKYDCDNGVVTFITKGINVSVQYGLPVPVED